MGDTGSRKGKNLEPVSFCNPVNEASGKYYRLPAAAVSVCESSEVQCGHLVAAMGISLMQ